VEEVGRGREMTETESEWVPPTVETPLIREIETREIQEKPKRTRRPTLESLLTALIVDKIRDADVEFELELPESEIKMFGKTWRIKAKVKGKRLEAVTEEMVPEEEFEPPPEDVPPLE